MTWCGCSVPEWAVLRIPASEFQVGDRIMKSASFDTVTSVDEECFWYLRKSDLCRVFFSDAGPAPYSVHRLTLSRDEVVRDLVELLRG